MTFRVSLPRMPKTRKFFFVLSVLAVVYRLSECFRVPIETTDVVRNLGYAQHAFFPGFRFYRTVGDDFAPEAWTLLPYHELTFQYPPVTLCFFAAFAKLGLGLVGVKLALTGLDLACGWLLWKRVSPLAAVLYLLNPVDIFYTAREGQFDVLVTFLVLFTIEFVLRRKWGWAGLLLALAFQAKQYAICLLPWFAFRLLKEGQFRVDVSRVALGFGLGVLPFVPFYLARPDLWLLPLQTLHRIAASQTAKPLATKVVDVWRSRRPVLWIRFFTYLPLGGLAWDCFRSRKNVDRVVDALPAILFLFVLRTGYVRLWYFICYPAFLVCLGQRKRLIELLLLLHLCLWSLLPMLISNVPISPLQNKIFTQYQWGLDNSPIRPADKARG